MHEDAPVIKAKTREKLGSRYSRRVREAGGLPAVIYGHKQEPAAVTLDAHEALRLFKKGERVFTLEVEGVDGHEYVLLKDVQYDYLGTNVVHCDLERVDLDERVSVSVPVRLVGEARGLKKSGSTLMHPVTELEIECAVVNLPEFIEVEVTALDVGDSIKAGDVGLPKGSMKLLTDPNAEVAHIVAGGGGGEAETDEAAVVEGGA